MLSIILKIVIAFYDPNWNNLILHDFYVTVTVQETEFEKMYI